MRQKKCKSRNLLNNDIFVFFFLQLFVGNWRQQPRFFQLFAVLSFHGKVSDSPQVSCP